jgi:peptide chain release factor 2
MQRLAAMKAQLEAWTELDGSSKNLEELLSLAVEESDDSMASQLQAEFERLKEKVDELEFKLQLSGEYDDRPAIISVKSGAGGVDAQDWAQMLFRMYSRWAERHDYKIEVMDETPGDEAGVKSAAVKIDGDYVYGYLRSERGVHRLVRLSPFDSDHRRHTSFALVEVLPEPDQEEEVKINPDDIRIDVFRAGGHGGQNVQKLSTAVRITHIPTGLVVSVQNERSQLQNRDVAMRILHARLVDLDLQRKAEERAKLKGEHVSAEFGRQVRSYVLHPYQMVKDHRTGYETGNAQAVLDGEVDDFLKANLASQVGEAVPVDVEE